ncbi:MAG: adenine phosphoribosyltransferase [Chloroflexi bacterium]|nr:adenine phosphoribosyltransferase [Chloroflexota bacterium]
MNLLEASFHDKPLVAVGKYQFILNALTEQVPAVSPGLLREAATRVLRVANLDGVTKLVGEEDRGAILVAAVALASDLPLALVRWNPSGVPGQIAVEFAMEYAHGTLYLNGVERGDQVLIVDDLISTGGTLIALIRAIRQAGAQIRDVICVAEKIEYGGVARVQAETGVAVKTLVKISIAGTRSRVIPA